MKEAEKKRTECWEEAADEGETGFEQGGMGQGQVKQHEGWNGWPDMATPTLPNSAREISKE